MHVEPDPRADRALYRISSLAGRVDDPHQALQAILAVCIETLAASSGSISLLNPDTGKLEIDVHQGLFHDADEVSLRLGQGITGWVAFHGRPQLVADVTADARYISIRKEVRSEMASPMVEAGGQIIGVINVDSDRLGGFNDTDLALLIRICEESTAVMQRLWQLRHLHGKARQLESLITIGQSLVGKLEQQELFDTITRDARVITNTRACAFYLYDSPRQTLRLISLTNTAIIPLPEPDLPVASCLLSSTIHTRKQVEFLNIQSPEFLDV
ncbi:MAG TPA: GAF domain-containing protein, partial [Rariglobus sp.]